MKSDGNHIPGKLFTLAANDYKLFLEKGYPQKSVLSLVCNRYSLSAVERSLLYRGISKEDEAACRRSKMARPDDIRHQELHIDGYNVLFTISSYLSGKLVFISNDYFLRDSSEIHGKVFLKELMDRSLLLLFPFLETLHTSALYFYFDEPVSYSGELCVKVEQLLKQYQIPGSAITLVSPDFQLKALEKGISATSDSVVIDRSKVNVLDLPRHVITQNFKKDILDINSFLESGYENRLNLNRDS